MKKRNSKCAACVCVCFTSYHGLSACVVFCGNCMFFVVTACFCGNCMFFVVTACFLWKLHVFCGHCMCCYDNCMFLW